MKLSRCPVKYGAFPCTLPAGHKGLHAMKGGATFGALKCPVEYKKGKHEPELDLEGAPCVREAGHVGDHFAKKDQGDGVFGIFPFQRRTPHS